MMHASGRACLCFGLLAVVCGGAEPEDSPVWVSSEPEVMGCAQAQPEVLDGELCESPSTAVTAAALGAHAAPTLLADTTYGVHLRLEGGRYGGVVSFTPERSGTYTVFLATPPMPLRVVSDGGQLAAVCLNWISGETCRDFRRAYGYPLQAGRQYRLEFGPIVPQSRVRLRIQSPPSGLVDRPIVFAAALGGAPAPDLYTVHPDGTELTRLTQTEGGERFPRWSPDHSQVAYLAGTELYVANADGGGAHRVAARVGRAARSVSAPAWSPDSNRLIYPYPREPWIVSDGDETVDESYETTFHLVNADGTGDVPFAEPADSSAPPGLGTLIEPAWSSTGWILFRLLDDCPDCAGGDWWGLVRADGSEFHQVSPPGSDVDWSPDGTRWAFTYGGAIAVSQAESETATELPATGRMPHWSTDGRQIAFIKDDGIYVINADGTGERRVLAVNGVQDLDW